MREEKKAFWFESIEIACCQHTLRTRTLVYVFWSLFNAQPIDTMTDWLDKKTSSERE